MVAYVGIDPGENGAWSIVDEKENIINAAKTSELSVPQLLEEIALLREEMKVLVFIEKVAPMAQGKIAVFKVGQGFGFWEGFCAGLRLPYFLISPHKWQHGVLDFIPANKPAKPKEDKKVKSQRLAHNRKIRKEAIASYVLRTMPEASEYIKFKKDYDIADAICIALYGIRTAA